jgi:prepilin-type N-terminal cleavage/methylation domain-containing protein
MFERGGKNRGFNEVEEMWRSKGGFTLIELVMIIIILGILAAVAVPKFQDLREESYKSAAEGYIGGVRSAIAIDWAAYLAGKAGAIGNAVTTFSIATSLLEEGSDPPDRLKFDGTFSSTDTMWLDLDDDDAKDTGEIRYILRDATTSRPAAIKKETI